MATRLPEGGLRGAGGMCEVVVVAALRAEGEVSPSLKGAGKAPPLLRLRELAFLSPCSVILAAGRSEPLRSCRSRMGVECCGTTSGGAG